jgi:hypothetical protein
MLAALCLCLAIACSWSQFQTIFSSATDHAVLRSPSTTLATSICLSSFGLAFAAGPIITGVLIVAIGILLPKLVSDTRVRAPKMLILGSAAFFLACHLLHKI